MRERTAAVRTGLAALVSVGLALGAAAQGAPPPAPKPAAPTPDPALEAARAAFEALPEPERRAVQDALVWTGDYNGVTTGGFGRRTFEGIATYQRRTGGTPTGQLGPSERTALASAAEAARKAARFRVQTDGASGAAIGVPERLLSKRSLLPGGTRWQSADGRVTLDTRSFPPGTTNLDALFERATAASPERKVTYKLKKPDFVVVTAETATGRSYVRYALGEAGIRGFALGYDRAMAAEVEPLVIAVANSFSPFPAEGASPSVAPPPSAAVAAPKLAPGPGPNFAAPPLAPPTSEAHASATGLNLGGGRVLTAASALENCPAPRVGGLPARSEGAGPVVVLRVEGLGGGAVPPLRTEAPGADEALLVLAVESNGGRSVAPGVAGPGGVFAPLQPGAGGAPVLDRAGRLVGLVARAPAGPRLIAGVMPPTRYPIVPGNAVAAVLKQSGVTSAPAPASAASPSGAAAPVLGAVVGIVCGR
ncbi:peptidoglycan-binding protein [Methylobacterium sp. Leaf456]|uniref:peptidoglycan-binding domain-containing protein n=1 Tax=Methylobacterium sp. Leaf456 TaxID=1736382 RepID=UPI0006FD0B64|nr:peptidoglycan-binding domain-containing protein [Methylobacterium sp. Leaf456]KQT57644.1 peptidoglycan-binding protein [Methylobacterium sp. Leaf456]